MQVIFHPDAIAKSSRIYGFPEAKTVEEAVEWLKREVDLIDIPFIVTLNGIPLLRKDWNSSAKTIEVRVFPGMAGLLIATLAISLLSIGVSAYFILTSKKASDIPSVTGGLPTASDVFSFQGRSNTKKLNEPIEASYGLNRWYPSFFALPTVEYVSNVSILHCWLSLGYGELSIKKVMVGDTDISTIPGCSYHVFPPYRHNPSASEGDFQDIVYLGDKTDVDLAASDSTKYETISTVIAPADCSIDTIQINFSFGGGLYGVDSATGDAINATVVIRIGYRLIDRYGNPREDWVISSVSYTSNQVTPQRFTEILSVPSGRYEVSVRRTNKAGTTGSDAVSLSAVYGKAFSNKETEVSLLKVTLTGSNSIGTDSASKINIISQRLLFQSTNGIKSTAVIETRSPIWAIVDMLTSPQGGNLTWDSLDLSYWEKLASEISENFDAVFTNKTNVFEACNSAASVFKGSLFVVGSDFRVAIDKPNIIPVTLFTPDNASDLSLSSSFTTNLEYDSVSAAYIDPDTGLQATIQFTPPGSQAVNTKEVTLSGVSDRQLAWRLAAYQYQKLVLQRDSVTFTCGLDGLIPLLGDVIMVQWPFPAWVSSGVIISATRIGQDLQLTLSDEVPDSVIPSDINESLWVVLRKSNGDVYGPVKCTFLYSSSNSVIVIPSSCPIDFSSMTELPIIYAIGPESEFSKTFTVTSSQLNDGKISVEAIAYDSNVFAYDMATAPDPGEDRIAYVLLSEIPWIKLESDSSNSMRAYYPTSSLVTTYYRYLALTASINLDPSIVDTPANPDWISIPNYTGSVYIPTSTGILEIKVEGNATSSLSFWRGIVNSSKETSTALVLSIVGPELEAEVTDIVEIYGSTNISGDRESVYPIAAAVADNTGTKTFLHNITSKTSSQIQIRIDAAISGPTTLQLVAAMADASSVTITKITDDKGFLTFTKADLIAAGVLWKSLLTGGSIFPYLNQDPNPSIEGHDKPALILKSTDSYAFNLMLLVHDSPTATTPISITSTSEGFNPGLSDYWTSLYGLTSIKKYITLTAVILDYPDAKINWGFMEAGLDERGWAIVGDASDSHAPGDSVLLSDRTLIVGFMQKATSTISDALNGNLIGCLTRLVSVDEENALTYVPIGFLNALGNSIIPSTAGRCFIGKYFSGTENNSKHHLFIWTKSSDDTPYDLTATDRTNLANAFKVYRLDKRIDEAFYNQADLTTIRMVATPISAFGVSGTSAELDITSQS